jgi:hypothetical protein
VSATEKHAGTVWVCSHCGNERKRRMVPVGLANDLQQGVDSLSAYLVAAAGPDNVLLPVATLNAIADRAERAEAELERLRAVEKAARDLAISWSPRPTSDQARTWEALCAALSQGSQSGP